MILLDNREVKKGWEPLKETVDSVLTKNGAELVVAKRWDERKLAYEIRKQRRATYYLAYFKADPQAIDGIRHGLGLTTPVLRTLVLTCDEIPAEAYEPEREFDLDRGDSSDAKAKEETPADTKDAETAETAETTEEGEESGAEAEASAEPAPEETSAEAGETADAAPDETETPPADAPAGEAEESDDSKTKDEE